MSSPSSIFSLLFLPPPPPCFSCSVRFFSPPHFDDKPSRYFFENIFLTTPPLVRVVFFSLPFFLDSLPRPRWEFEYFFCLSLFFVYLSPPCLAPTSPLISFVPLVLSNMGGMVSTVPVPGALLFKTLVW